MNIKKELKATEERMFSDELFQTILAAYQEEVNTPKPDISEVEYEAGKAALSAVLTPAQKEALAKAEALCEENAKYALPFAFTRGVYASFQQFFSDKPMEDPFEDLVIDEILMVPGMNQYGDYVARRTQANDLFEQLENQLSKTNADHVVAVDCAWDDRLYGVLQHAFYLGYRYALAAIDAIAPVGSIMMKMMGNILFTEYRLGFTFPKEERERFSLDGKDET